MEIVEFLRARLDEDERVARAALGGPDDGRRGRWGRGCEETADGENAFWSVYDRGDVGKDYFADLIDTQDLDRAEHIARHDPAQVLRDIEAKRRIVDELAPLLGFVAREDYDNTDNVWCGIASERAERHIRLLVSVWSDHPDYRQEWKP